MISAFPALSELATADRQAMWRAARAAGQGMLIVSGGLAVAVVAVNSAFVPRWVGAERYAGPVVTALALTVMVARHWCCGLHQVMLALGAERFLTLLAIVDGAITIVATLAWSWFLGPFGVPLGSLTGLALASAPAALMWLARCQGVTGSDIAKWYAPWIGRCGVVLVVLGALSMTPVATMVWGASVLLVLGCGGYALAAISLLHQDPLRDYSHLIFARFARLGRLPSIVRLARGRVEA
jgi:hypothetical protein